LKVGCHDNQACAQSEMQDSPLFVRLANPLTA